MSPPTGVSAIILSYNRPDFLRRVLLSHAAQTRHADEVIISDDGSSMDVAATIADVLPGLPFPVLLVQQPHREFRAAKCRNNGIRAATGDYVVFADQDIIFTPAYIETFVAHARPGEFLVGYPVRLDGSATARVTDEIIRQGGLASLVTRTQARKVRRQYRKETLQRILYGLGLRSIGPKLRSGVFGAWRADLLAVNGFDEEYEGWGNEDDNLGLRLHRAGIGGRNAFGGVFTIHMDHPLHHDSGKRVNSTYHAQRVEAIRRGETRARHGVEAPFGGDESTVTVLHQPRR